MLEQTIPEQALSNAAQAQPTSDYLPSDWEVVQLEKIGTISGGSTPSTTIPKYWGGDIPWLTPSEVTKCEELFISQTDRNITKEGLANCSAKLLPVGTVMMSSRATIGEVAINAVPMVTNQGFININCDDDKVFNEFLAYWVKQNKPKIEAYANGVTFREVSKSNFKNITALLPPLPQQRAIAKVLRTVQEAMQTRREELQLERERKDALMEYLFTHGTRGEITKQAEIGEIPANWEVKRLGEVATLQRGFDLPESKRIPGSYPVMGSNGVTGYHFEYKALGPGVFLGRSGSGSGKANWIEENYWPHNAALWVSDFHGNDPKFIYFCLFHMALYKYAAGASIPTLNRNAIHPLLLALPSIDEQNEIATILTACDTLISCLEGEMSILEELFNALLEELMSGQLSTLPLIEEGDTYD